MAAAKYAMGPEERAAAVRRDELARTAESDAAILTDAKLKPQTVAVIAALARSLERELGCTPHSAVLAACTFLSR